MPLDRDPATVLDMIVAGRRIQEFIAGQGSDSIRCHPPDPDLGRRSTEALGRPQQRIPEVPWSDMIGMRNILIHHYEGADLKEVWEAASQDVPRLLAVLEPLIPGAAL
jgi:hypothetical protein